MGEVSIVINGMDLIALTRELGRIKNRYVKITLDGVENVFNQESLTDEEKYRLIRKQILDGFNDELRTVLRTIFDYDG